MSEILCVGCGKDISDKVNDRRNLCSNASSSVLMTWKDIFMQKVTEQEDVVQGILEKHRMCRRCFSAIDKLTKLQTSVEDNIKDAIDALLPSEGRKRQEPTRPADIPAPKRPPSRLCVSGVESRSSPSVTVSCV